MSRHAARVDPEDRLRGEHLAAAAIAFGVTAGLAVAAQFGRTGLVAGLATVQAALVVAWVVGTGLPGRIGGLLIGLGAAAGMDTAMLIRQRATLSVVLGVLSLCFIALLLHQLARGVIRVRVTESLSGLALLCTGVVALGAYLALDRVAEGGRLVSATVTAAGLALVVGHLVDTVLPVPRFSAEVPHGLLAVGLATAVGALVGSGYSIGSSEMDLAGGALLGAVVAGTAAMVAVGVGYVAQTAEPRASRLTGLALPYLRVALPLAFTAPVGYVLGLYVVR
jgi:hypothetical protein